jgi:hypothetical protein
LPFSKLSDRVRGCVISEQRWSDLGRKTSTRT